MKKKLAILFLLITAVTAFIILNKKEVDPYKLELFGNIEIRQVDLGFRVEGKIDKIYVEEGDSVEKGQLLASLDSTTYKANYEKSLAEVGVNKSTSENAQARYERHLPLCKDATTSKQECDDILNAKNASKSAFEAAVAASKTAKKNFEDTNISAPDDGVIMTRIQEPGAVVTPGQPVLTMAKTKPVWVRAYIAEPNLANVKYGMKVNVYTDTTDPNTGKKREYTGFVGYISPVAEFTPKTVQTSELRTDLVYRIRVYIYDIDEYLRQGMPVTIIVQLKEDKQEKN